MNAFPEDENGAVLQRMHEDGDDLAVARDIDFTVVFATQEAAQSFAETFSRLGHRVSHEMSNCVPELPWDVRVVKHMVPTHQAIEEFEAELEHEATAFGGRNDGWGCFAQ
jgi:hypothetical protein